MLTLNFTGNQKRGTTLSMDPWIQLNVGIAETEGTVETLHLWLIAPSITFSKCNNNGQIIQGGEKNITISFHNKHYICCTTKSM